MVGPWSLLLFFPGKNRGLGAPLWYLLTVGFRVRGGGCKEEEKGSHGSTDKLPGSALAHSQGPCEQRAKGQGQGLESSLPCHQGHFLDLIMTVTFPQGGLGVVPAFQLRNLQVYMYCPHLSPPSTELSPQAWGWEQISVTGLATLAAPTPRKDGPVLLTQEEGGGCVSIIGCLQADWTRVPGPCHSPRFRRSAP